MIYNRYIGTKLVRPQISSGYQEVDVFANLPAANTENGNTYLVRQDTVTPNTARFENGFYRSNGITWVYLGLSQPEILTASPSETDEIHALTNKATCNLKKLKKTSRQKIHLGKKIILPENHIGRYYGNRKVVGKYIIKYFKKKEKK